MKKNNTILKIENLIGKINEKTILKNFNIEIKTNEIHFLMGPNGCGKSTLSKVLAGHPSYTVEKGNIKFLNKNLLELAPEIRAKEGLFLAFQYPLEILGVNTLDFLKIAYDEQLNYQNKKPMDPFLFVKKIKKFLTDLNLHEDFLSRDLNVGFSGGEKKLNELLQVLLLKPKFVIFDEVDSGLDIDGIQRLFSLINKIKTTKTSFLIITHNPKILEYLEPDKIHIMVDGCIRKTGGIELVESVEKFGFDFFKKLN